MKTKTQKKTEKTEKCKHKNRERVRKAVESVRGGARCLWRIGFEKKKVLRLEWKNDGVMDDKSGDGDADEVRWSW